MKVAQGKRPISIWLFAGISTFQAIRHLTYGLGWLDGMQQTFERTFPWFPWNEDWTIVALSAWFTIELIPVVLVFLFASNFARWFVLVTAFIPLAMLFLDFDHATTYPRIFGLGLFYASLPVVIALLLFMPEANRWFETDPKTEEDELAVFE